MEREEWQQESKLRPILLPTIPLPPTSRAIFPPQHHRYCSQWMYCKQICLGAVCKYHRGRKPRSHKRQNRGLQSIGRGNTRSQWRGGKFWNQFLSRCQRGAIWTRKSEGHWTPERVIMLWQWDRIRASLIDSQWECASCNFVCRDIYQSLSNHLGSHHFVSSEYVSIRKNFGLCNSFQQRPLDETKNTTDRILKISKSREGECSKLIQLMSFLSTSLVIGMKMLWGLSRFCRSSIKEGVGVTCIKMSRKTKLQLALSHWIWIKETRIRSHRYSIINCSGVQCPSDFHVHIAPLWYWERNWI